MHRKILTTYPDGKLIFHDNKKRRKRISITLAKPFSNNTTEDVVLSFKL